MPPTAFKPKSRRILRSGSDRAQNLRFDLLNSMDWQAFEDHLLRLDRETRCQRFGEQAASGAFLSSYALNVNFENTAILGCFAGTELRASAELRSLTPRWSLAAEVAIVVEAPWQGRGLGFSLLMQTLRAASTNGMTTLYAHCDPSCLKCQRMLRRIGDQVPSGLIINVSAFPFYTSDHDGAQLHFSRIGINFQLATDVQPVRESQSTATSRFGAIFENASRFHVALTAANTLLSRVRD